jgi:hypothetical protein
MPIKKTPFKKAPSNKKVSMVQAPPVRVPPPVKSLDLTVVLQQLGNDRPYTLTEVKPDYWLVHFLGDSKPTKIMK